MVLFEEKQVVLSGGHMQPRILTGVAGQAWLMLDKACVLHYQILTNGYSKADQGSVSVYLRNLTVNYRGINSKGDFAEKLGDIEKEKVNR